MEAFLESDMLYDVGYWDPIRRKTIIYDREEDVDDTSYPPLLEDVSDSNDADSDSELPRPPPSAEGYRELPEDNSSSEEELLSTNSTVTPSDDFWVMHLTARTLGQIRTKPPTRDHILLRKVAEYIWKHRTDNKPIKDSSPEMELEHFVRAVCEVAVKNATMFDRRDFYIGLDTPDFDATALDLDESSVIFKGAVMAMAVYLNDNTLLEDILSPESSSLFSSQARAQPSAGPRPVLQLSQIWVPDVELRQYQKGGLKAPECGRSLIRVANPTRIAVHMNNMQEGIIFEVSLPRQIEFLRVAIESGPPLTRYLIVVPALQDTLIIHGRTHRRTRSRAGIRLSEMLDKTTDLEVFSLAYDAIMAGYNEEEQVWWTRGFSHINIQDDLPAWGLRRIQRAVLDDCLPIARRLLDLGYSLDPTQCISDSEDEQLRFHMFSIHRECTMDTALPTAARRGNLEMVKLLFEAGAQRKRKNIRKAMRIAMEQENIKMLEVLVSKGSPAGLLNRKAKRRWRRELEAAGKQNMLAWLELM
ncbi:hypothetical protein IL306_007841 [Fusarium sp. DS 682]|nr:hypothetical protein IL306_007841 [Fusarium sp. DS 682]